MKYDQWREPYTWSQRHPDLSGLCAVLILLGVPGIPALLRWAEVIDWNWWWVLAPFWVGLIFTIVICALGFLAGLSAEKREMRYSKDF